MIQSLNAIHERNASIPRESHVHDVSLGGRHDDALHPFLALILTGVAPNQLHPRAGERQIERPRARRIGEEKAHDLSALRRRVPPRLPIH